MQFAEVGQQITIIAETEVHVNPEFEVYDSRIAPTAPVVSSTIYVDRTVLLNEEVQAIFTGYACCMYDGYKLVPLITFLWKGKACVVPLTNELAYFVEGDEWYIYPPSRARSPSTAIKWRSIPTRSMLPLGGHTTMFGCVLDERDVEKWQKRRDSVNGSE